MQNLRVSDVNDNVPRITSTRLLITRGGDTERSDSSSASASSAHVRVFGRLEAVDADAGDNAKIRFEVLEPKQTPFRVHPETGDVTVVSMRSLRELLAHKYYELR